MRDEFELSRRKMLAGIGALGATSTGAGMGTTAYFNDTESFEGNEIVAGELDLKVDWEEHYSYPQLYGKPDPTDGLRVTRTDPNDADYVGLPNPNDPMVWVHVEDLGPYMMGTSIEAFPDDDENDGDGDGIQDGIEDRDDLTNGYSTDVEADFRAQFADVPADLDSDLRTESSRGDPLIDLQDVKPGDFGEITFSFHLFDNPGYLWFTAELVQALESGHTEPEADEIDDGDETGAADEVSTDVASAEVELLDEIRMLVWHDDGDNVLADPDNGYRDQETIYWPHVDDDVSLTQLEAIITDGLPGAGPNGVLTLREFLEAASADPHGIPLDAFANTDGRDCYPNSTTRYLCLAWWLPADVGNEVQSDSVQFNLGFYTEQCRHNDGSGQQS